MFLLCSLGFQSSTERNESVDKEGFRHEIRSLC